MRDRTDLHWQPDKYGFALHVGQARQPAVRVTHDPIHPGLWRVWYRDGSRSDFTNLTRACDAATGHVLAHLRPAEGGIWPAAASPVPFFERPQGEAAPKKRALQTAQKIPARHGGGGVTEHLAVLGKWGRP